MKTLFGSIYCSLKTAGTQNVVGFRYLFTVLTQTGPDLRWFVLDAILVSQIDVTGWHTVTELMEELQDRQIRFVIAGRRTQIRGYAQGASIPPDQIEERLFPTVGTAVRHYFKENPACSKSSSH